MRYALLVALLVAGACGSPADQGGPPPPPPPPPAPFDTATIATGIPFIPGIVSGQQYLVADNTSLYWTEATETPLRKVPRQGGTMTALAPFMDVPVGITVHSGYMYWIDSRDGDGSVGCTGSGTVVVLWRAQLDGSGPTQLAVGARCSGGTTDIYVDDTHAYWVTSAASPNVHTIRKVPVTGGASAPLVSAGTSREISGLTGDADHIYWGEGVTPSPGEIMRISKSGGAPDTLATGLRALRGGLALRDSTLYFGDTDFFDEHRVLKVSVLGGPVTTLADITGIDQSGLKTPRSIIVAPPDVYWADATAIHAVPTDSGAVRDVQTSLSSPISLAAIGTDLVWIESICCAHGQRGTLKRGAMAGGGMVTVFDSLVAPTTVAVTDSTAIWLEGGPIGSIEGFGRIAAGPIGGGSITTLASGISRYYTPIAVDNANVYIADRFTLKRVPTGGGKVERLAIGDFGVAGIATDGSFVYWTEDPFTTVRRVSVNGGPVTTLAPGASGPAGPARVIGGNLYWMDHFTDIRRVPVGGGTPQPVATNLPFLSDFVVDNSFVYYAHVDIRKVPGAGGAPVTLVFGSPLWAPYILAAGDTLVFWVNQAEVGAVPKSGAVGTERRVSSIDLSLATFPNGITARHDTVYWTDVAEGTIRRATPHH